MWIMSVLDFAPLYRSAVGFDRVLNLLQDSLHSAPADNYPPYNIEKTGEQTYRITLAVAGFSLDEITITARPNQLMVAGKRQSKEGAQYLHQGIANRSFERRFEIAEHIEVTGASLENGLLSIELKREVPEAMKPRTIQISGVTSKPKMIEQEAA
jgi:molecular chaperone IbpA